MILDWLFKAGCTMAEPSQSILEALGCTPTYAGKVVSQSTALTISAVYASARILSEPVGGVPFKVFERTSAVSRRPAPDHPLAPILRWASNAEQTAEQLRVCMMLNVLLTGNGYAEIYWDNAGRVRELVPIPSAYVTPERKTPTSPLQYRIVDSSFGSVARTVPKHRMWHVAGLSYDGLIGLSVVRLARQSFGVALAAEHHAGAMLASGAKLSGVLSHPGELKPEIRESLETSIGEKYGGPENAGKWLVLEEGMQFAKVQMSSDELQFLESRRFDISEVARWFNVPLHRLAEHISQPRANMEQQGIEFVVYSLSPWIVRFEQTAHRDLLRSEERGRFFCEMNVAGLLRGDLAARYKAYSVGRQWGWLSVNDIRALENMNPLDDGGDEYLRPLNMVPVGDDEPAGDGDRGKPSAPARLPSVGPSAREQALVEDAAQRVVTRETRAIRKAIEKQGAQDLGAWADDWYQAHVAFVARALAVSERAATAHVEGQKHALAAAARGGAEQLERLLLAWETSLPAELATEVQSHGR